MCEFDHLSVEELLAATFAAQRESYDHHLNRESLDGVRDLIRQELLNVFGAFERDRREWHKDRERDKDRSFGSMSKRATIVASRVVRKLAAANAMHSVVPVAECGLKDVLVLRVDEAFSAMNRMFPLGQAPYRQLMAEVTLRPGWPQLWVVGRLTRSGALISDMMDRDLPKSPDNRNPSCEFRGSWSGWGTAPGLELVVLKRDGSGFLVFRSGERRHFEAVKSDAQLPESPYGPEEYAPRGGGQKMVFDYWLELDERAAETYWKNRAHQRDKSPRSVGESL
jgi:hypothetical protein